MQVPGADHAEGGGLALCLGAARAVPGGRTQPNMAGGPRQLPARETRVASGEGWSVVVRIRG